MKVPTIFGEVPEDINEDWTHGATLGGAFSEDDEMLGASYFAAGAALVDHVLSDRCGRGQDWLGPVLFNYRHGIELYLKAIVRPRDRDHRLGPLLEAFCRLVREKDKQGPPKWVTKPISEFINLDRDSLLFRYGEPNAPVMDHTHWIDFHVLRRAMVYLEWAFKRTLYVQRHGLKDINAVCPAPRFEDSGDSR